MSAVLAQRVQYDVSSSHPTNHFLCSAEINHQVNAMETDKKTTKWWTWLASSDYHFTASLICVILYAVLCSICCIQHSVTHFSQGVDAQYWEHHHPWPVEMGCAGPEVTSHKTTQRVEENPCIFVLREINVQWIHGAWFFILDWIMFRDYNCVLFSPSFQGCSWQRLSHFKKWYHFTQRY